MEKVKLINKDNYFVESKKAIQVVLEKERSLYNALPKRSTLNLLKKRKEKTGSIEEYERISELEKRLELEIKFNKSIPLVPGEYKEIIKRNVLVEEAEVNNQLTEMRKELKKQLPYLQNVLMPMLVNIQELKRMQTIPNDIERILTAEFMEGTGIRTEPVIHSRFELNTDSESVIRMKKLIKAIDSMSV
jgi:hypothetical protein